MIYHSRQSLVSPIVRRRDKLESELLAEIQRRAGHLVLEVAVNVVDGRVIVRGAALSYYGWQLAQAACKETLSRHADMDLDCAMTVEKSNECLA